MPRTRRHYLPRNPAPDLEAPLRNTRNTRNSRNSRNTRNAAAAAANPDVIQILDDDDDGGGGRLPSVGQTIHRSSSGVTVVNNHVPIHGRLVGQHFGDTIMEEDPSGVTVVHNYAPISGGFVGQQFGDAIDVPPGGFVGDWSRPAPSSGRMDQSTRARVVYPSPPTQPEAKSTTASVACVICTERVRSVAAIPCGHFYSCVTCALAEPRSVTCAVCKAPLEGIYRIYTV